MGSIGGVEMRIESARGVASFSRQIGFVIPVLLGLLICSAVGLGQVPAVPPSVDNAEMRAQFTAVDAAGNTMGTLGFRGVISINRGEAGTNSNGEITYPMEVIGAHLRNLTFGFELIIKTSPEAPWEAVPLPSSNPSVYFIDMLLRDAQGNVLGSASNVPLTPASNFPQGPDLLVPVARWYLDLADTVTLIDPNGNPTITLVPNPDFPEVSIIQNPSFSVDPASSVAMGPSVIYYTGAPPIPGLMVLTPFLFEDNVNAFCHGVSVTDPGRNIYFSVDRNSLGVPGSAVNLAATAAPPFASSSEFGSMGITTGAPPLNTLVLPYSDFVLATDDDVDALDNFPPNFSDSDNDGVPDIHPAWFSLSAASSTTNVGIGMAESPRAGLPADGIRTSDDIFVFLPPGAAGPGGSHIYASGRIDIGLVDGIADPALVDDIDALVLMPYTTYSPGSPTVITPGPDNQPPLNADGTINIPTGGLTWDLAFFSLSRDSVSLGGPLGYTAADVFVTNFNGTFMRLHQAADLDLTGEDNINAMKFMLTSWHGSVAVLNPWPTPTNVLVVIGKHLVRLTIPTLEPGGGFPVAEAIADGLNASLLFQARPWMRAIARDYNSGLLTIIGSGNCNTVITANNPNLVITPLPFPLPFPLFPPAGGCPGDECDDPIPAVLGFNPFDTTECGDSPDPYDAAQCPATSLGDMNQDIWFTYTPDECGMLKVDTCGTASFDTDLVAYHAISCSEKIQIACNGDAPGCANFTSEMQFPVTAGNKYLIRLGGWNDGDFGNGELRLELVPDSTIGDECIDAIDASLGLNWLDTSCATDSPDAVDVAQCPGTFLGAVVQDVWYVYTPDLDGLLNVRTCNLIDFDSDIVVYKGSCTDLEQIACNGDGAGCAGFSSAVEDVPIVTGDPIYIRVGGWQDGQAGKGLLELEFRQAAAPPAVGTLTCTADCTDTATLTWVNGGAYDSINIYVNGTLIDTIGGTDTSYTATGISGIRNICVEPVAGGLAGPQACCPVFGLTPPPENINCDPIFGTTNVGVAWTNPVFYDAIEVYVNGVFEQSLPGTATGTTVTGGVGREICVRGLIANCWSEPVCCETGQIPGVGDLNCDVIFGTTDVAVAWSNPIVYDIIEVYLNGTLVQTLSGTETFTTVTGVGGTREICVIGIISGVATDPACCTVNTGGPSPTFIRGDTNRDGQCNIADVINLLSFLFVGGNCSCMDACDVNDDGQVNIADAIFKLTFLFTQGVAPPAPYPGCGPDPTPDNLDCASFPPC